MTDLSPRLVCSLLWRGCSGGETLWREGIASPLDCDTVWTVGDLFLDLLCRGGGGGRFCTGCRDGALDDHSLFLVFGGMVFVSFVQSFPLTAPTIGGENDTHLIRRKYNLMIGKTKSRGPEREGKEMGSEALTAVSRRHSDA